MGYFQARYDSRVVIYDRRALIETTNVDIILFISIWPFTKVNKICP